MAGSINKVVILGNIVADPQIRQTQSGQKIANFTVATSERWKNKQTGEYKENTEYHKVVIYNPNLAGVVESLCQKGTKVYVEGSLKTRKWQNQQGKDVYTTEVTIQQFGGELVILVGQKQKDVEPIELQSANGQAFSNEDIPF